MARERGAGSGSRKVRILRECLSRADAGERDFLVGLLTGEMRQGALEGLVVEAVAKASDVPASRIRQALMFSADIGEVARAALEEDLRGLSRFRPRLFHPVSPMLAKAAEGTSEALQRLGEAGWEFKIDGARIQVHKEGDEVRIYSRHLKEVTERLPEIVERARAFPVKEAIVEGEVVAQGKDGRPLPFQATMRRIGRIQGVERMQGRLPLRPFFFDLLFMDGEPLLEAPYGERFELLTWFIPQEFIVPRKVTGDEREAEEFLLLSRKAGHEGVMAKGLASPYVAGQRGSHWLKIKPARTLDLVVLAAEWGHGRRKGWLSNLHLGARDEETGGFVMLGKTFKGLTDAMLRWQTQKLLELEIGRDPWTVHVRPELVVEVAFSDIQVSPRYCGGLALRFARVRRYREDKSPLEADTIQTVRAIHELENKKGGRGC
jgi:DNA ligase-1